MTYIYKPRGLQDDDRLVELHADGVSGIDVIKPDLYREIFVPRGTIHHGYAYLGDYLNFHQRTLNRQPIAQIGDVLAIQKMPANSFLLDVNYYLYPEKIVNYNRSSSSFHLQIGFGTPGGDGPTDFSAWHLEYDDRMDDVEHCRVPRGTFATYWQDRYAYMMPVRSYMPPSYVGKEVELCCRVTTDSLDTKYECHIWYSWCDA